MKIVTTFILIVLIVILSILVYSYYNNIVFIQRGNNIFTKEAVSIYDDNKNPIFTIDKIILYSSASAIDNSKDEVLQDLDLYQYTDISIYINNKNFLNQLTEENTISELYIDNIKIEAKNGIETRVLNYKNPKYFAAFKNLNAAEETIKYNVIHTNSDNEEQDYNIPTFYTDCTNPITLGYVNKRFLTNCKVPGTGAVSFDGTILKQANVDLEHLECTMSFTIHIKNNLDEEYRCDVKIDNNLDGNDGGIYTGYIMRVLNIDEFQYDFFKMPK